MADHDEAFLHRVRNPNPMLEELARQAVDELNAQKLITSVGALGAASAAFGVPIEYILDEMERRVREAEAHG